MHDARERVVHEARRLVLVALAAQHGAEVGGRDERLEVSLAVYDARAV